MKLHSFVALACLLVACSGTHNSSEPITQDPAPTEDPEASNPQGVGADAPPLHQQPDAIPNEADGQSEQGTGSNSISDDTDAREDQTPVLHLFLTDAPAEYDQVWVTMSSVEVQTDEGWLSLSEQPQDIDLLTLRDGVLQGLGMTELPPGHYGQMRILVENAEVVVKGESYPMQVASGAQTGIKLPIDLELEENTAYEMVLDFDAAKSVKSTGHGFLMTPVIKVQSITSIALSDSDGAAGAGGAGGAGGAAGSEDAGGTFDSIGSGGNDTSDVVGGAGGAGEQL